MFAIDRSVFVRNPGFDIPTMRDQGNEGMAMRPNRTGFQWELFRDTESDETDFDFSEDFSEDIINAALNKSFQSWQLIESLHMAGDTLRRREQVVAGLRDDLVRLASLHEEMNCITHGYDEVLETIVHVFFPSHAREFWETFMEHNGGVGDKSGFLNKVMSVVKTELSLLLIRIDTHRERKETYLLRAARERFGQLLLTAVHPLSGGDSSSSSRSPNASESDAAGDEDPLFTSAVFRRLLDEAVLLYDTGVVTQRELVALGQNQKVKDMLAAGNDNKKPSTMAAFLRQVLCQPRGLESTCVLRLAGLIEGDLKGKLDRARSMRLPNALCEKLVNLSQTLNYLRSVKQEWEAAMGIQTKKANSAVRDLEAKTLRRLIDF